MDVAETNASTLDDTTDKTINQGIEELKKKQKERTRSKSRLGKFIGLSSTEPIPTASSPRASLTPTTPHSSPAETRIFPMEENNNNASLKRSSSETSSPSRERSKTIGEDILLRSELGFKSTGDLKSVPLSASTRKQSMKKSKKSETISDDKSKIFKDKKEKKDKKDKKEKKTRGSLTGTPPDLLSVERERKKIDVTQDKQAEEIEREEILKKYESSMYNPNEEMEYEVTFFEDEFSLRLKDDMNPEEHWETLLVKHGGSVTRIDTLQKRKYLSSLIELYFRDYNESKFNCMKWIAKYFLRGSKQAYLNYLCDHCFIQFKMLPVTKEPKQDINNSLENSREFSESEKGIPDITISGDQPRKKSSTVASRTGKRTWNKIPFGFGSFASFADDIPVGRSKDTSFLPAHTGETRVRASSSEAPISKLPIHDKGGAQRNPNFGSLREKEKGSDFNLSSLFDKLLQQERLREALDCKKLIDTQTELTNYMIAYDKAKEQDLLHEAIEIRENIKKRRQDIDYITEEMIAGWANVPLSTHLTLEKMGEFIIDRIGTKMALPFLEEFADISLATIAKEDIVKAIQLQEKAMARMLELAPLSEDELRARKSKEEEERWLREAQEKKKRKKERKTQLLEQLSQASIDLSLVPNLNNNNSSNMQSI